MDSPSIDQLMRVAGALVAAGAAAMLAKGVLLILTGNDRSFTPWFGLLVSVGFAVTAIALWRSADRVRPLIVLGGAGAAVGGSAGVIAVVYLLTGTIPETPGASDAVGFSYALFSAGIAAAVLCLGIVIVRNRSLRGSWRWLPVGLLVAQLPIFAAAGAIGVGIGSEELTDGLGLSLTGAAWMLLGYVLAEKQHPAPIESAVRLR